MNRVDTTQSHVLQSLVALLVQNVPGLNSKNCFISLYPDPPSVVPDELFCTVSVWNGTFPEELQAGGGANQCTEYAGVMVKCFSRMRTDRTGHDVNALIDEARGLLNLKWQLLRATVGQDLVFERNLILRNLVLAHSCSAPEKSSLFDGYVEISLVLRTDFDWDLTS